MYGGGNLPALPYEAWSCFCRVWQCTSRVKPANAIGALEAFQPSMCRPGVASMGAFSAALVCTPSCPFGNDVMPKKSERDTPPHPPQRLVMSVWLLGIWCGDAITARRTAQAGAVLGSIRWFHRESCLVARPCERSHGASEESPTPMGAGSGDTTATQTPQGLRVPAA